MYACNTRTDTRVEVIEVLLLASDTQKERKFNPICLLMKGILGKCNEIVRDYVKWLDILLLQ